MYLTSISKILDEFVKTHMTQSAHTDELMNRNLLKTNYEIFHQSLNFFNEAVMKIKELDFPFVQVDLYMDLLESSNKITRLSLELDTIIDNIDSFGMPEIFISKPEKNYWQPKIEFYIMPLPFAGDLTDSEVNTYYYEYRSREDMESNNDFTRLVVFSYLKTS
jgi:hypothetical protein